MSDRLKSVEEYRRIFAQKELDIDSYVSTVVDGEIRQYVEKYFYEMFYMNVSFPYNLQNFNDKARFLVKLRERIEPLGYKVDVEISDSIEYIRISWSKK